jgi:hypothetical protein
MRALPLLLLLTACGERIDGAGGFVVRHVLYTECERDIGPVGHVWISSKQRRTSCAAPATAFDGTCAGFNTLLAAEGVCGSAFFPDDGADSFVTGLTPALEGGSTTADGFTSAFCEGAALVPRLHDGTIDVVEDGAGLSVVLDDPDFSGELSATDCR